MDRLIDLNCYGTTCHMRLFADKLVQMTSDTDFKRLVDLIVRQSNPLFNAEGRLHLMKLKHALKERKLITDNMTTRSMKKADINYCRKQIDRRIKVVEDAVKKYGHEGAWSEL